MKRLCPAGALLMVLMLSAAAEGTTCETEADGCLPWGITVIGRIGSKATRVSLLSGDGQTAMLEEKNELPEQGASFRLGTGIRSFDRAAVKNEIEFVVFTDLDADGRCGTGWYDKLLRPGVRSFFMERINGTMTLRRRPERFPEPIGDQNYWSLQDDLALGITDSCEVQVGASRAEPQVDTQPIWGRIGMVWNDAFPFVPNLPPTFEGGDPEFLFALDDAAEQSVDWPSIDSQANEISPDGLWVAGFSAGSVTGPPLLVTPFPAVWSLVSGTPLRIDWPVIPGAQTTDVVGDLLTFTSVGFTPTGATEAEAWRASGPLVPTFELLGTADLLLADRISITADGTAVVPLGDEPGVRFHPIAGGSFTSSERLLQLGLSGVPLPGIEISADAVSSDGRIWGGSSNNDAVLVNTRPIKAAFLGDSFTSGEGARDWPGESLAAAYEAGTANESSNLCHRSIHAWPYRVKPRGSVATFRELGTDLSLGDFSWDFVACSGAETAHFFDIIQGFDDDTTPYGAPDGQFQTARIPSDVNLIAFTIGGNDAGFSELAELCLFRRCLDSFFGDPDALSDAVEQIKSTVRLNLRSRYGRIRNDFPNAEIFALGYPLLLEESECPNSRIMPGVGFSTDEARWIRSTARLLNEVIQQEALQAGLHFVPVESRFEGRNVCGVDEALNGVDITRVTAEQGRQKVLHPNIDGAGLYAEALSQYLASHAPFNAFGVPDGR